MLRSLVSSRLEPWKAMVASLTLVIATGMLNTSVRERRFTRPRIRICFQNARLQSFTLQVFEITVGQQFRMERSDNRDKARRSLNSPGFASLHPGYDAQSGLRWV